MLPIANNPYGRFVSYTLTPPLALQPGDEVRQLGNTVTVVRNGAVVATRTLTAPTILPPQTITQSQTVSTLLLFKEHQMAATIKCVSVSYEGGGVQIEFEDGSGRTFNSPADVALSVVGIEATDLAKDLLIKAWLYRSSNAADPTWLIGKTLQLNLAADLGQLLIGEV